MPGAASGSRLDESFFLGLLLLLALLRTDDAVVRSVPPSSDHGLGGFSCWGELMMVSQITACEGGLLPGDLAEGYDAVTQTKSCLVFQLKSEVRSASRSNLMMAYSSRFVE